MEDTDSIQCPYCGQSFELVVDVSQTRQDFITDCEICCRPIGVRVECESGRILRLDIMQD